MLFRSLDVVAKPLRGYRLHCGDGRKLELKRGTGEDDSALYDRAVALADSVEKGIVRVLEEVRGD